MSKNKLRFNEAKKYMHNKMQSTANQVGAYTESESKLRTPVDTGHLRRSITHDIKMEKDKASVHTGTNVEYGPTVELGLGDQQAQPYLVPAISENVTTIQSLIYRGLKI